jgi:hypothetical protein
MINASHGFSPILFFAVLPASFLGFRLAGTVKPGIGSCAGDLKGRHLLDNAYPEVMPPNKLSTTRARSRLRGSVKHPNILALCGKAGRLGNDNVL